MKTNLPALFTTFLMVLATSFSASAAQYFQFTKPSIYYGEFYPGVLINNQDNYDRLSGPYKIFAKDEIQVLESIEVKGGLFDNYSNQLKLNKVTGNIIPYHLIGNKKNFITKGFEDEAGELILNFMPNPDRSDGKWDVAAIWVKTINIANLEDPKLNIAGKDLAVNPELEYSWTICEFTEDEESLRSSFNMSVESGRPIGFQDIRVYLKESRPDQQLYSPNHSQSSDNIYKIPAIEIGGVKTDVTSKCHIYNMTNLEEQEFDITFNSTENCFEATIPNPGQYGVAFELTEKFTALSGIDGVSPIYELNKDNLILLNVLSDIALNLRLNDSYLSDGISYIHNESTHNNEYNWTNAVFTQIPENTIIYWKVENDPDFQPEIKNNSYVKSAKRDYLKESSDIPEGYTLYDEKNGIDLTKGNKLSLITEKEGVRSEPFSTYYLPYTGPVSVSPALCEDESERTAIFKGLNPDVVYYLVDGRKTDYNSVATGTLLIAVSHSGKTIKFVKH